MTAFHLDLRGRREGTSFSLAYEGDEKFHISDYYYFVVAVAVVAILLLASNVVIVGCCSRFSLLQSLKRFLRSRGLLSVSNHGDNISRLIPATKYSNPGETDRPRDRGELGCGVVCTGAFVMERSEQLPAMQALVSSGPCMDHVALLRTPTAQLPSYEVLPKGYRFS
ncbi:uncharacterized protein A4U43_C07F2270 [Asparagus officinalis]|uniref:Uncharacterized protein n=1 Tax=Asparagus officinalis TaxID=4686 RepID=A0A5P1EBW0_ASPOF|nr:uncharacterized protein A4U43_C07F2270 [Asparagus officinalis]